jgi:DNA-binding XRE family transcriptional regulator
MASLDAIVVHSPTLAAIKQLETEAERLLQNIQAISAQETLMSSGKEYSIDQLAAVVLRQRKELKIGQRDVAEIAAISQGTLSAIESGRGNPTLGNLKTLGETLGFEIVIRLK